MELTEMLPEKFIHVLPKKPQTLDNQLIYTEIHSARGHAMFHYWALAIICIPFLSTTLAIQQ